MIDLSRDSNTKFYYLFRDYCYRVQRRDDLLSAMRENEAFEKMVFSIPLFSSTSLSDSLTSIASTLSIGKISLLLSKYSPPIGTPDSFQDDLISILMGRVLYRSARGIASGVTFIIGGRGQKFVFKWTDYNECVSNKIYRLFLHIIGDPHISLPMSRSIRGHQIPSLKWLEQPPPKSDMERAPPCLMLYEQAPGAPFIDFIAAKYNLLNPEQQLCLFTLIGKIGMIDLVLGHQDRFFKLDLPLKSHKLIKMRDREYGEYANLGNLLVDIKDEEISVYLIDNGAYTHDQKIKYLTPFFRNVEDPTTSSLLIDIMTEQILEAVKRADFFSKTTKEMEENLTQFSDDLVKNRRAIQKGIYEMTKTIQKKFENPLYSTCLRNLKPSFKQMGIYGKFFTRIAVCKTPALLVDSPPEEEKAAVASP